MDHLSIACKGINKIKQFYIIMHVHDYELFKMESSEIITEFV